MTSLKRMSCSDKENGSKYRRLESEGKKTGNEEHNLFKEHKAKQSAAVDEERRKAACSAGSEGINAECSQPGPGVILPAPIVNQSTSSSDAAAVEQLVRSASYKECDKTDDLVGLQGSEEAVQQTIASQDGCDLLQQQAGQNVDLVDAAANGHNVAILPNDLAIPHSINRHLDIINVGNLLQPFPGHPSHATNAGHSVLNDSLERIRIETAQLDKSHEYMVSQMKSDRKKEIEELLGQIHKKYEFMHQETEVAFRKKKSELEKSQDTLMRSKTLAETFRSTCLDLRPSGVPGMRRQGNQSWVHPFGSVPVDFGPANPRPPVIDSITPAGNYWAGAARSVAPQSSS